VEAVCGHVGHGVALAKPAAAPCLLRSPCRNGFLKRHGGWQTI
jgi:hypothetical protein